MLVDTTFIYALTEPGTRTIRYFGKADDPQERRTRHIWYAKDGGEWRTARWIRKLLRSGQCPDVHVLREVPQDDFERFERAFIALGKQYGFDLTNLTDGGEGASGRKQTPEWCEAHRVRMTGEKNPFFGRKHTPDALKKMSAAKAGEKGPCFGKYGAEHPAFGLKPTPEKTAKVSLKLKGRKRPPEFCEKLSRARTGEKRAGASSRFHGVCWKRASGKWQARINVVGKRFTLGYFSYEIEAAQAYDIAAKKYHGAHAVLNFPG